MSLKRALLRYGPFVLAVAAVAVFVALLDPRLGLSLFAGLVVLGGLAFSDNIRRRQRWIFDPTTGRTKPARTA